MAGYRLVAKVQSELQEAGLDLLSGFFRSVINPEGGPPMRIPDSYAGTTAVFKTPLILDLPYSGVWNPSSTFNGSTGDLLPIPVDGYSEVIVSPGSNASVYHTLGAAVNLITIGDRDASMIPCLASKPPPLFAGKINNGLRLVSAVKSGYACLPKLSSSNDFVYEMLFGDPTPNTNWTLSLEVRNIGNPAFAGGARLSMNGWFDELVPLQMTEQLFDFQGSHATLTLIVPGLTQGTAVSSQLKNFWVEVADIDPSSHWVISLTNVADLAGYPFDLVARSACAFRILDAPAVDDLSETEAERTTSLSGMCSYMGSHLQDGGVISAARLGMGLSPIFAPAGDVYSYLASLPLYNDDFALKEGAYSWWLPDSIQEHFYVPYRKSRSDYLDTTSLLAFAMHRDDPTQGVRLRVVQCLEVVTRSRLYASEPAPVNPSYDMMVSTIKILPAVTRNETHVTILDRALKSVKGWVSKPANWFKLLTGGASLIKRIAGI
jgi:hypothetical protein